MKELGIRQFVVLVGVLLPSLALAEAPKILFILDGSGSMNAKLLNGQVKMAVAKAVTSKFINELPPNVSVGLETYGHTRKDDCNDIEVLVPMGGDRTALIKAVNALDPKGSTPLTGAIRLAVEQLRETEVSTSVVVVSDGEETCGGDPCAAVREARGQGVYIKVHVVGFDVKPEESEQLQCIALAGNGKYFPAANAEGLSEALAEVSKEVVAPPKEVVPANPPVTILFEDHFDRNELGEEWEVLDPDPNRMTFDGSKLLVVATHPVKNRVNLRQTFPGDFVATVAVTMQVTVNNWISLLYTIDGANYLSLTVDGQKYYNAPDGRRLYFKKVTSGQSPKSPTPDIKKLGDRDLKGFSQEPEIWYLQIKRVGNKYTGRVSADGKRWVDVDSQIILNKNGRLGLSAGSGEYGHENAAEFEDFVVKGTP